MRVWTVVTQKGGAGKTTLSLSLAVAAVEAGERTLVIDCDEQGSATSWWESRPIDPEKPYLVRAEAGAVRADLERAESAGFDHVVIDTPGFAGVRSSEAASAATLAIVPCQPSVSDMRSTFETARMLTDGAIPFAFVLNRCPSSGREEQEAADAFRGIGLVCDVTCRERKAHKRSYALGLGITEYAALHDRTASGAADEMREIYRWLRAKEDRLRGQNPLEGHRPTESAAGVVPPTGEMVPGALA